MNQRRLSITHQKAKGTYQRNQQIRKLFHDGDNMAEIGRWFKLSRQAVRKIISEPGE
tara:strand:- start:23 stop:193 length:171 start_codon:yes stop_codon:yes gene_type:complete